MIGARVGVGVIGPGDIAAKAVPDILAVDGIEVVAIAGRSVRGVETFAERWGIERASASVAALLDDDHVDLVYICTPHGSHSNLTRRALLAGKHVLCEKPMTLSGSDARDLARLADSRGLFLMEAMWMRFNPNYALALERVRAGSIGTATHVHAQLGAPFPKTAGSRFWNSSLGASAQREFGVYSLALAIDVFGTPRRVRAFGPLTDEGVDFDGLVMMEYEGNRTAVLTSSMTTALDERASIAGTTAVLTFDRWFLATTGWEIVALDGRSDRHDGALDGNGYGPMFEAVRDALMRGAVSCAANPLENTITALDIIDESIRQFAHSDAQ